MAPAPAKGRGRSSSSSSRRRTLLIVGGLTLAALVVFVIVRRRAAAGSSSSSLDTSGNPTLGGPNADMGGGGGAGSGNPAGNMPGDLVTQPDALTPAVQQADASSSEAPTTSRLQGAVDAGLLQPTPTGPTYLNQVSASSAPGAPAAPSGALINSLPYSFAPAPPPPSAPAPTTVDVGNILTHGRV